MTTTTSMTTAGEQHGTRDLAGGAALAPPAPRRSVTWRSGTLDPRFWDTFQSLGLPPWLFPVEAIADGRGDRVVTGFYARLVEGESIPYARWAVPLLGWGSFIVALFASL